MVQEVAGGGWAALRIVLHHLIILFLVPGFQSFVSCYRLMRPRPPGVGDWFGGMLRERGLVLGRRTVAVSLAAEMVCIR